MALTDHRPSEAATARSHPDSVGRATRSAGAGPAFPNPHRRASLLLALITFISLVVGAAAWLNATPGRFWPVTVTTVLVLFLTLLMRGHFRVRMIPDTTSRIPLIGAATALAATAAVAVAATGLTGHPDALSFTVLLVIVASAAAAAQAVGVQLLRFLWRRGLLRSAAVVLGSDDLARELAIEICLRRCYGVDVVAFVASPRPGPRPRPGSDRNSNGDAYGGTAGLPAPVYDSDVDLAQVFAATGADRLIIGPAAGHSDIKAVRAARWAAGNGVPVFVVPRFYEMGLGMDSMTPDRARGYPLVRLQRAAHPQLSLKIKRALDLAVAGGALLVASPVMVVAVVAVRLSSPGPVLFGQRRVGQHGRLITVWKFRSMTVSGSSDVEWTAESRVTAVGAFLRRSNIDELPQLWSIVRGDMSLVGPRPERPVFVERFRREVPDYDERHRMPVGLTGLAQIVGLRGDTSIAERIKYDNLYIDQWSVGTDLQILAKTVIAVLRQSAYRRRVEALEAALGLSTGPTPHSDSPIRAGRSTSTLSQSSNPRPNRVIDLDALDNTEAA